MRTFTSPAIFKRILAVSFAYPPLAYPRAIQVARLLRHLPARTVVVCADEQDCRHDPTLEPQADLFLEACLRVPFVIKPWRRLVSRLASKLRLPIWNKVPDPYRSWKTSALARIDEHLRHQVLPDILISFGQPMSDHLIGLAVQKRHGIPWVAHFSDPWVNNPFHHHDRLTQAINLRMEKMVVVAAERLVFTSLETMNLVMGAYPAELRSKARVIPHAFDPQWYPSRARVGDRKLTIRYIGELYGQRTPKPLFDALHYLLSSNPGALSSIRIELIGALEEKILMNSGIESLPKGLVTIRSPVSYEESLALMVSADGLLVIDAPAETSIFLPSKLIDYIGAGRPVLGITPGGTSANLIRRLGGWVAAPADVKAVSDSLVAFLTFLQENRTNDSLLWGDALTRTKYEAPSVASAFRAVLEEVG